MYKRTHRADGKPLVGKRYYDAPEGRKGTDRRKNDYTVYVMEGKPNRYQRSGDPLGVIRQEFRATLKDRRCD